MRSDADPDSWVLDVTEDLEIPGWLFLPRDLAPADREQWLTAAAEMLSPIIGTERWDGASTSEADLRELLQAGLDDRASSDAVAMFQVWPVHGPIATTCIINIFDSASLPEWTDTEIVVHRAEATHIGPGMQCSTRRTVNDESGQGELTSVHFLFDDGAVTFALSLEESVPAVITRALAGFLLLKDVVTLTRASDGVPFTSVEPTGILEDPPWQMEGTA